MLKLLIAVDGSEPSRRAVEVAARLGKETGSVEVVLLNVRESPGYYGELPPFDLESIDRAQREHQQSLLEAALTHARLQGLHSVNAQAVAGLAAPEIVKAAAAHGVDQIVLGTRGMNALGGLLLGSVAQRVVHLAEVPVLLVK
jgi:nucleotide-binding universal stress UspA family protein